MVIKSPVTSVMWVSRDVAGSGMYSLWVYNKPVLTGGGFFSASDVAEFPITALLMTIHPSRWPWPDATLDRGSVMEVRFTPKPTTDDIVIDET